MFYGWTLRSPLSRLRGDARQHSLGWRLRRWRPRLSAGAALAAQAAFLNVMIRRFVSSSGPRERLSHVAVGAAA